jgi:hypothetical protein
MLLTLPHLTILRGLITSTASMSTVTFLIIHSLRFYAFEFITITIKYLILILTILTFLHTLLLQCTNSTVCLFLANCLLYQPKHYYYTK